VPWYPLVAERVHDIQNPTSAAKIRLLGERLRLGPHSRVLDIACGRGGPALVLASAFGCRIHGVERAREFADAARERAAEAGLEDLIEIVEADARKYPIDPETWDVALCLGATFVWDGLDGTLAALTPAVRAGGYVVVGEPYWRQWPLSAGLDNLGYVSLAETVTKLEASGLSLVSLIAASRDDWDRYQSPHWQGVEEWLAEHSDDPGAAKLRQENEDHKRRYLEVGRELFGWVILAGWKR
jgi:SAM-dependent methyltransferase